VIVVQATALLLALFVAWLVVARRHEARAIAASAAT
jgi:hypothetical protein